MAKPSFQARVLVLKKTKLGESDLIITALQEDGSLIKAVAKGARKPNSPFASRLEIFSLSNCLIAQGKNLHIFSEAHCENAHSGLRGDILANTAAFPIVESVAKTAQEGLEIPHLFEMTEKVLCFIESSSKISYPIFTAAFLLKLFALLGLRPRFCECVSCLEKIDLKQDLGRIPFSYQDGGVLCCNCCNSFESTLLEADLLAWCQILLMSRFDELQNTGMDTGTEFAILQFCQNWCRQNLSLNLKSLDFLFSCGLF